MKARFMKEGKGRKAPAMVGLQQAEKSVVEGPCAYTLWPYPPANGCCTSSNLSEQ